MNAVTFQSLYVNTHISLGWNLHVISAGDVMREGQRRDLRQWDEDLLTLPVDNASLPGTATANG